MENFGQRLNLLRRALNLTESELSELSGVGAETIKRIERRGLRPSRPTIIKLARALNVLPEALFGERRRKNFKTSKR